MTLKARVARLESSAGGMLTDRLFKRQITCTVRLQSIEADTSAAFVAAGLQVTDGDIIRQIVCEWPGQHHPVDPAFAPQVLEVRSLMGNSIQ